MIGEYHIRKLIDPMEPSKGKEWKDMTIRQGRDNGYVIDWGYNSVQDITLYRKPTIDEWIQSGYIIHDRLLRPAIVGVSKKSSIEKLKNIKEKKDNKDKTKSEEN